MSSDLKVRIKNPKQQADTAASTQAARQQQQQGSAASPNTSIASPPAPAPTQRKAKNILDYLCSLSSATLTTLYHDPHTVLTIFRSLPPLAKQYLLRLVCIGSSNDASGTSAGIPVSVIEDWCRNEIVSRQAHHQSINRLTELHILHKHTQSTPHTYALNRAFQQQLQRALCNQIPAVDHIQTVSHTHRMMSVQELNEYAQKKWNQLLHFMVGVKSLGAASPSVQRHLVNMKLMMYEADPSSSSSPSSSAGQKLVITPLGFSFLFKDQHTQVWDLLLAYLSFIQSSSSSAASPRTTSISTTTATTKPQSGQSEEMLTLVFHLSFLTIGCAYRMQVLTESQRRLLQDLSEFGLVYIVDTGQAYYPTPLAFHLSSSTATTTALLTQQQHQPQPQQSQQAVQQVQQEQVGYLIIETTFKVYAYTTSPFQLSLLSLFLRFDYQLPNMLVATITKDSIRHALKQNISSMEIIAYMQQYAHPAMRILPPSSFSSSSSSSSASSSTQQQPATAAVAVLPENVVDQIRLWELERNRLLFYKNELTDAYEDVCLLQQFINHQEYEQILELMQQHQCVLYENAQKLNMVVKEQGLAIVKEYKQKQQQQQSV